LREDGARNDLRMQERGSEENYLSKITITFSLNGECT
jgi:hypothetical protein